MEITSQKYACPIGITGRKESTITVKEFKRNIDPHWEAVKLVDAKGRFVGHAEHRGDWDEAEVKSSEVIKRDGFPNFYVVTI